MSEEDLDNFIKMADVNNDGEISWKEFLNAVISFDELTSESKLKGAFDMFDEDGDKNITPEELLSVFSFVDGMNLQRAI